MTTTTTVSGAAHCCLCFLLLLLYISGVFLSKLFVCLSVCFMNYFRGLRLSVLVHIACPVNTCFSVARFARFGLEGIS